MTELVGARRGRVALGALALLVFAVVLLLASRARSVAQGSATQVAINQKDDDTAAEPTPPGTIAVKTIRPRRDAAFRITVDQPAFVEAYYLADVMARVAGPIKSLDVDVGDRVKEGEVLVRIDAPDLEAEVLQKQSIVAQREQELALAQANVVTAAAAVDFAQGMVKEKESDVLRARSTLSFRDKELKRFRGLASGNSPGVTSDIVDERTQFYEAAVADSESAKAAVQKAKAGVEEAQAKLAAARVDNKLKAALVDVARQDVAHTKALLGFATLNAPFDGAITRRNAGPGSFVQNAANGRGEAILTVARTDIVTVYMKLPDNYASFIGDATEATIELGALDWKIHGKVTRFAPSLQTPEHDRTMRVEVDLFNGSAADYANLVARAKATNNAGLKGHKLPVLPTVEGKADSGTEGKLLPGMFGTMRLQLRKFANAWLIPSTSIVSQGGRSAIFVVVDGRAKLIPVKRQVDDGRLAKVALLQKVAGREVSGGLTGDEVIIATNQGELTEGQPVKPVAMDW